MATHLRPRPARRHWTPLSWGLVGAPLLLAAWRSSLAGVAWTPAARPSRGPTARSATAVGTRQTCFPGSAAAEGGNFKGALLEWVRAKTARSLSSGDVLFDLEKGSNGFKATVRLPCVEGAGAFQGSVCSTKKAAERSAAQAAWQHFAACEESVRPEEVPGATAQFDKHPPATLRDALRSNAAVEASSPEGAGSASGLRFSDLALSKETKRSLREQFGHEFMTDVQEQSIVPLLEGMDLLGRAKTGSGKTLAFLIPIVERLKATAARGAEQAIGALVVSPARELAHQIAIDAEKLLAYHSNLGVQCVYGGTNINREQRQLATQRCDVLIATPGRLNDHITNTPRFAERLQGLQMLVLDEADTLLDMGFRQPIVQILGALPDAESRQSMLFSATFPKQVSEMANLVLKPSYTSVNTVELEEQAVPQQIAQRYAVTSMEETARALWGALHRAMERAPSSFKIIAFFPTARLTQYWAEVFRRAGVEALEIHSRKKQAYRTRVSGQFRSARSAVLFSSDVSARGVDYPGVTEVIQVGVPASREQYVHRTGRTGRAGRAGRNTLLLHDFERNFLRELGDMQMEEVPLQDLVVECPAESVLSQTVDERLAQQVYQAWLGYYNGMSKVTGWSKQDLIAQAERFARSINAVGQDGLPPPITKRARGKMGLKNKRGLNVVDALPWES